MNTKRLLVAALAVVMAFALVACSSDQSGSSASSSSASSESLSSESASSGSEDSAGGSSGGAASDEPMNITLITMDQMDVHWVKLEEAARKEVEAKEAEGYKINYSWLAPEKKDNAQQIQQIEVAINNGSDAIIIAVNDLTACNDALQQAIDAGIKLIYVDSPAELDAEATYSTDNYAAGQMAGDEMLAYLKENNITEGKIGLVGAQAGSPAGEARLDGFKSRFEGTDYELPPVQYSDGDATKAQELANNLLNDGCVALFGANDGSTTGVANATREANNNGGHILCVGFDNTSSNRELVRDGALLAFMAQNPTVMGEQAIDAAVDLLSGKEITEKDVDTGVSIVTADNVDDFED